MPSLFEIIGFICTGISVHLLGEKRISGWAWGLVGNISWTIVAINSHLYLLMILQFIFAGLTVKGVLRWRSKQ